jgi:hypothetical protein
MSDAPAAPAVSKPSWTLRLTIAAAMAMAAAAVWLILSDHPVPAGLAVFSGGACLIAAGAMVPTAADARAGVFAVSIAGRVFDGVVLGSIVWETRGVDPAVSLAALVALGASFLAAYIRSRGRALGFSVAADQPLARAAFLALVGGGLLFVASNFLAPALWAAAAVAAISGTLGAFHVGGAARKERA